MTMSIADRRLSAALTEQGLLTDAQIKVVAEQCASSGVRLADALIDGGHVSEVALMAAVTRAGVPTAALTSPPTAEALACLTAADARSLGAVPLRIQGGELHAAFFQPLDSGALGAAEDLSGLVVRAYQAPREALRQALEQFYPVAKSKGGRARGLGDLLVELGVDAQDVQEALAKQNSGGGRMEDTLMQSGKVTAEMVARSMAMQLNVEYIDPSQTPPDTSVALIVPEATARRYMAVPIRMEGQSLVVAMKDPRNVFALDDLRIVVGRNVIPAVMSEKEILRLLERYHGASDMAALNKELAATAKAKEQNRDADEMFDDNAVVRVVDSIIREAALQEASDIHIEPTALTLKVRLRIDGTLRDYQEFPMNVAHSVLARIKILGNLDIAEKRVPQDGRVRFRRGAIDLDLRLSTLPTVYGEKAVMRLLQKASNIPEVENLGLSEHNFQRFIDTIEKPYGILLITGPTGSGKSFTTFSILKRISTPDSNTTTIEDPVEYEIPGINQTQVNTAAGLTFARALRAFLRQDPDIIMVGEIRDAETAQIATEAALTGHLVIATLHTNDAPGAVLRLEEMGVERFNIGAALIGVLGQRLVRRICKDCRVEVAADPEILRKLGLDERDLGGQQLYKGSGCARCNQTGYRGRAGVHELMVVDEPVRRAIGSGKDVNQLRDVARRESAMRTLREDGLAKVLAGITTLDEILANTNA
ncbi:type II/IV secretion system protein [Deinococcus soli (ex Cha et al. 2016)]|uniref:Type IV pilus assembly protein PilB n=2 Tax=Deinococcus soli (ex Cha et al. 2016) TaxID=1309411 RepID=A0ACC6KGJ8_9DEIO|nr:type II/IV secretion system protein [Deinococcus soli (ex Cha et al. 2016)]MDR6219045.1 type IV pilus assembly protein PilB [Deinococcus soli (ex Cha et al. 2016)]MDR6328842.1 type IV pilus assembly protein PilB [Deinococcus soli (ex Cha et al. 2016)]MDR6751670.1 type IV pilus assembly protein PilB [Deinococcus soli (ex Cha et al. 2016)]